MPAPSMQRMKASSHTYIQAQTSLASWHSSRALVARSCARETDCISPGEAARHFHQCSCSSRTHADESEGRYRDGQNHQSTV
eukprot:6104268-Amphidinium_carterae.5